MSIQAPAHIDMHLHTCKHSHTRAGTPLIHTNKKEVGNKKEGDIATLFSGDSPSYQPHPFWENIETSAAGRFKFREVKVTGTRTHSKAVKFCSSNTQAMFLSQSCDALEDT